MMNIADNLFQLHSICDKYGIFLSLIIWKNTASGSYKDRYWRFYQPILFFAKSDNHIFNTYADTQKKARWSPRPQRGQIGDIWTDIPFVYSGSIHHKEAIIDKKTNKKIHPTQMPEKLIERIIKFSSNEGDTVLDPFLGSGTTLVACQKLNRNGIGFEINPEYEAIIRDRLKLDIKNIESFG
jgi:DNA modification methylase